MPMQRILILGGTGFVGRAVCERLVERNGGAGGPLIVATRRLPHGNRIRSLPTVELAQGDVHDDAFLRRLVSGCDAVINLIAILHGNADAFDRVHVQLPRRLAAACRAAGVSRLVHVSALGVPDADGDGGNSDASSNYLRSKARGEGELRAAGLALTVLRPSVIFGVDDRFMNVFAQIHSVAPVLPLAGSGARFQPVWVEDVAQAIVACLDRDETIAKTYECAGPSVYTLSELVRLAGRWSGHERLQLPLPMALGRLQALAMECLPGEPLMSRDNLDSMRTPNVASGRLPGLPALGITPAALEAIAPDYLGQRFARARLTRWRAEAGRV